MAITVSEDGSQITYDKYVKRGSLLMLRSALGINDPDFLYNYLKSNNIEPENYGIKHPAYESALAKYGNLNKDELLSIIGRLEYDLEHAYMQF